MDYGRIISFGFTNAWKYKSLWILGFFISGGMNLNFNTGDFDKGDWDIGRGYAADIVQRILENPLFILAIIAVILAVILFFIIMGTISVGGLVEAARRFKTNETYRFGEVFGVGVKFFWRILGITLLVFITMIAFIIILVLIGLVAFYIHLAVGILSLLILIPIFIVGVFMVIATSSLAERLVVIRNKDVFDAIGDAYTLWTKNLGPTILYALIYFGISVGVFIATMMVALFIAMPFIGMAFVNWVIALILGVPIVLLALLIIEGFSGSAMHLMTTEFYYQITARLEGLQTAAAGHGPASPPAPTGTYPTDTPPPPESPWPPQSPDQPPPPPEST